MDTQYISDLTADPSTLVDLLRWRALHQPDDRAYTFLLDGETTEDHLTYGELDQQARAIATLLQNSGATGERALLLHPPGLDYIAAFFGCLYAGVVAVPAYPPQSTRLDRAMARRLRAVAKDAQPLIGLTTSQNLSVVTGLFEQAPEFQSMRWLTTDTIASSMGNGWQQPAISGETLAFLQYTSGSTTDPNGVMLTHGNLLHNSRLIHRYFENTPSSTLPMIYVSARLLLSSEQLST